MVFLRTRSPTLHFGCQDQNDEIARKASKVWSWKARMRLTPCLYALTLELGLKTCLELVGSKRSGFSQKNTKTEFVCHACHCHHPCSLAICDHTHVAIISHPKGLKNDIQYVFCPILVLTILWLSFSESSFQSLQSLQSLQATENITLQAIPLPQIHTNALVPEFLMPRAADPPGSPNVLKFEIRNWTN